MGDPARTIEADDFANLVLGDDEPTLVWERPLFFGIPVPPFAADEPIPPRSRDPRSSDTTKQGGSR